MLTLPGENVYRTFVKGSEVAGKGSSTLWVFIDEDEGSIDDPYFLVTMNDSQPFASFPASRHGHGYNLSFDDGHVEHYRFTDPSTVFSPAKVIGPLNTDWTKLKLVTTSALGQ
jgi:prepilin-type processing-associated H-X9-DG protein